MATLSSPSEHAAPLTRAEYEELVRRGVFEDSRVELLYGRISPMSPIGREHVYCVRKLVRLLDRAIGDRGAVFDQAPFVAPDESEVYPDVFVASPGDYLEESPRSAMLVIEVADSSLRFDRKTKAALYARGNVPEYWIVNLVDGVVEVHREPGPSGYGKVTRHPRGETLEPVALEGVQVPVDTILPPRRS